ncbi:MAG TPA: creatininase family protein [Pyrinomonadaceae bacterium]|jgi:creatinine amidohydrolase/Fe(II)-dependent formamide hydrolase-like protein
MKQILIITAIFFLSCGAANAQIYRVAQMNAEQIRALDKQKTVVILTGGILEEHGPHLPSFTDGYSNEWLTQKLAEEFVRRPGMSVLLFPTIPLGHEGANEIGATHVFPGTYSVRRATLRAIFMDLATELGEQGFKWIFIFHGHGAPFHNLMLDEACDYFRDTYGGRMIHLRGLEPTVEQLAKLNLPARPDFGLTEPEKKEVGNIDEHAGFDETSRLLFLRPDLVSPIYKLLQPQTTNNFMEFFKVARTAGWPGYLSSPRVANANYGALAQQYRSQRDNALALAILDGKLDERDIPRYSKIMTGDKQMMTELAASTRNELERERKQREWMKKKGIQ